MKVLVNKQIESINQIYYIVLTNGKNIMFLN